MNLLMVTPHLPPHQAANALLPHLLGEALSRRGHTVRLTASTPARCPIVRGNPRAFAQRPLPSMMMATWRG